MAAGVAAGLVLDTAGRIAVSVIALSLMLSPLWLIFNRRLERLVGSNVQTLREYLESLFAPEAGNVATMALYPRTFSLHLDAMARFVTRPEDDGHGDDDARMDDDG